jgi:hypothetical protein
MACRMLLFGMEFHMIRRNMRYEKFVRVLLKSCLGPYSETDDEQNEDYWNVMATYNRFVVKCANTSEPKSLANSSWLAIQSYRVPEWIRPMYVNVSVEVGLDENAILAYEFF